MKQGQADTITLPKAVTEAPLAIELRHLRYFVALADAGSFTHAAERMFIAQPTLSQQIRRLEEIVGTQLLHRSREGLQLTKAGAVLLDASRTVLSLVDHEVNRTRQAAGLGRQRLRVVVPPRLSDALAVEAASALRSAAAAADVDVVWIEAALDAEFSLIQQRRAEPGTYDAWTRVLRTVDPRFEFTDPPLRHSLPMDLAFAATADRPTAVLTGPSVITGSRPGLIRLPRPMVAHDMVRVGLEDDPLTATAALVWNGDLPRPLQQILFDAADGIASPDPAWASSNDAKVT